MAVVWTCVLAIPSCKECWSAERSRSWDRHAAGWL